jgi:hypothetical protein
VKQGISFMSRMRGTRSKGPATNEGPDLAPSEQRPEDANAILSSALKPGVPEDGFGPYAPNYDDSEAAGEPYWATWGI